MRCSAASCPLSSTPSSMDSGNQCDQMGQINYSKFGYCQQRKLAQLHKTLDKAGSKFCQMLKTHARKFAKDFKICQSGEILPNLVTVQLIDSLHITYKC